MNRAISAAVMTLVLVTASAAHADAIFRKASSGKTTRMITYKSWKPGECTANVGVVKVVSKPAHGTLTPRPGVATTIGKNRVGNDDSCMGRAITGFQVDYKSDPGYRGTDSFVIETTYGKRSMTVDAFTVTVE